MESFNQPTSNRPVDSATRIAPRVIVSYGKPKIPVKRRRLWPWFAAAFLLIFAGIGIVGLQTLHKWTSGSFVGRTGSVLQNATDIIFGAAGQADLAGEKEGVIRILLLGIGGEGHDGPYLSDTIILAQLRLDTNEASLTALPRDYQVQLPDGKGQRKINAAFAEGFAQNKDWNEAGGYARAVVEKLAGVSVPYFAVIDFSGFEKAVDQVGGVDVEVERTFTDYKYPNETDGYLPPQTFTQGWQHFNGRQALIFSRSRHAAGPEGSDFARSVRQQKIISALRQKVQTLNILTEADKIAQLLQTFTSHFHTNLTPGQLIRLAKIGQEIDTQNILSTSLDPATGLVCPEIAEESGAYILLPCAGKTTTDIQNFFQYALEIGKLSKEKSVIWIATQDQRTASYRRVAALLEQAGLTVWPITYTDLTPEQSVVFQVNAKPATAQFLTQELMGREVTVAPPNIKIDATRSDIILILGSKLPTELTKPLPAITPRPSTTPTASPTPTRSINTE
ncbi:MAG: LCP family protein [Candidatus Doudnabacteria bacterium]|nr:LCP family protein [Candidatus Doudnabacteria bacterium]